MKKYLVLILLPGFLLVTSNARSQAFEDGTNLILFGFGFPATDKIKNDYDKYKNFIDYKFNNYGTLHLKYERGLMEYFGVGLNLEYSSASVSYKYDDITALRYEVSKKRKIIGVYGRLNAHLPLGDSFDLYGGVGLGYAYDQEKLNDNNPNSVISQKASVFEFDYQLTLGARYMVKEGFGLFGEVGLASTTGQIGVALKF